MTSSGFRLLVAALIALSLGGKLAASAAPPGPDPRAAAGATAAALAAAGFDTRIREMDRSPGILVEARRGGCRLVAGDYPAHGTFAAVYRDLAAPLGPLRYAFRGRLRAGEPKLGALASFYLGRELRRIGIAARRSPVIALAAAPGCDLSRVDWRQTARVER